MLVYTRDLTKRKWVDGIRVGQGSKTTISKSFVKGSVNDLKGVSYKEDKFLRNKL